MMLCSPVIKQSMVIDDVFCNKWYRITTILSRKRSWLQRRKPNVDVGNCPFLLGLTDA